MSKTYFIADLHFNDSRILLYENRQFTDVKQMDEEMVRCWNSVVGSVDNVYVLGDFGAENVESEFLLRLNGSKFLIKGNHDKNGNDYYRQKGFAEVYDLPVVFEGFWILSHEPLYVNTNMPYANIFGHVHNSPMFKDFSPQHFCVSAERLNYTPVDFDTIKSKVLE